MKKFGSCVPISRFVFQRSNGSDDRGHYRDSPYQPLLFWHPICRRSYCEPISRTGDTDPDVWVNRHTLRECFLNQRELLSGVYPMDRHDVSV